MIVFAKSNFVRGTPRKLRLVAELIVRQPVLSALEKLKFIEKRATEPLFDVLRQAVGNAKNNYHLDVNNLIIKEILISEGPRLKRMDKSHSARFDRGIKQKRLSHIRIALEEKSEKQTNKTTKKLISKPINKNKIIKKS